VHFEASVVVRAPRERVYSAYTDFEAMPSWSRRPRPVRVAGREGDTVYLESQGDSRDGSQKARREMHLFPKERVESSGETRFTRTMSIVRFEDVPEGTKVTAILDVYVKGRWAWILGTRGRSEVEPSALEELTSFAKYVERLP
jgi:uncharacterized membrane protein